MKKTSRNPELENLIGDSGIIENRKRKQEKLFIALCQIISIILMVLGVLALFS